MSLILNIKKLATKTFLVATLGFIAVPSYALDSDAIATLHIKADSTIFNYKTGINQYDGNVFIDQGTTHLIADRVITKNNSKHKIEEVLAYGFKQNAKYITLLKAGDPLLFANAKLIKFYPFKSTVILVGNALVTQGPNSFNGPIIIYNIKDQVVTAPPSKSGKATIIIDPNSTTS
jgi:lipopolysaccharide export system protein LptA